MPVTPVRPRSPLPHIRSFRALRYRPEAVPDLGTVVSPPYDVVSRQQQQILLARDPRNVIRLDLPEVEPGEAADERYRRAARELAAWRSNGTLAKDPRPAVYVYEQRYSVPGTSLERTQRGFFARLRLEPFGTGDVLPHERTLAAPREDRYRLLRATGVNTSPVVGLFSDEDMAASQLLQTLTADRPDIDVTDDEGVRHRLWVVVDDGTPDGPVSELIGAASRGPITIADGHHRYETALQYRDERRMSRSCEEDPAFDYILMLFLSSSEPLTVLPTHRVTRGIDVAALLTRLPDLFTVRRVGRDEVAAAFASGDGDGGRGRFGLWARSGGALLEASRESFEPLLPPGGPAVRALDVTLLGTALATLCGIDAEAVTAGRIAYTKSASEALTWVDECRDGADAAFLLEATPVDSIMAVAAEGDVMPQKSTYFYPKALSGLVINPHEW
jgi:uncharacterized protein (DUF1015 family)